MPALVFYGTDGRDLRPSEAAMKALRWRISPGSGADRPVLVLSGGVEAWKKADLPFDDAPPRTAIVLSDHLPQPAGLPVELILRLLLDVVADVLRHRRSAPHPLAAAIGTVLPASAGIDIRDGPEIRRFTLDRYGNLDVEQVASEDRVADRAAG